jgi:hypothetical protein
MVSELASVISPSYCLHRQILLAQTIPHCSGEAAAHTGAKHFYISSEKAMLISGLLHCFYHQGVGERGIS